MVPQAGILYLPLFFEKGLSQKVLPQMYLRKMQTPETYATYLPVSLNMQGNLLLKTKFPESSLL